MSASEIEFFGAFEDAERTVLSSQFNHCRIELIRRAARDPAVCLISWSAPRLRAVGPAPLRSVPTDAVYVLRGRSLSRVQTTEEVAREFGESIGDLSLPGLRRPNPLLDSARAALRGLIARR